MKITASIQLQGETFSPAVAAATCGLTFTRQQEPGEIAPRGRFSGQPKPFGYASIEVPATVPEAEKLLHAISAIAGKIERLRSLGVTDACLSVGYFYQGQCNCDLSVEEIAALHRAGIPLCFSAYDVSDEAPNRSGTAG